MKLNLHHIFTAIIILVSFSCSEKDILLYHPEPLKYWLIEHVDYPEAKVGLVNRNDVSLYYSNDDQVKIIDNEDSDYIMVNYNPELIEYAKSNDYGTSIYYDSLLIRINPNKQAISALHVTYKETEEQKVRTQNDSTSFLYDTEGYLVRMERFSKAGDKTPTYWENYTIQNGNLSEIISSAGYKHVYIYNEEKYTPVSSYCYEMPFNTISITNWGGCWLLTNCRFISEYLGKRNKNNVAGVKIFNDVKEGKTPTEYANISYDFIYNEKGLVSSVDIRGMINKEAIPEGFTTVFSYLEKTVVEE